MVKNCFSINLVKIRIKTEYLSLKKPPKSVSVTGNPYHVACLIPNKSRQMWPDCLLGVVPQPTDSRLSESVSQGSVVVYAHGGDIC